MTVRERLRAKGYEVLVRDGDENVLVEAVKKGLVVAALDLRKAPTRPYLRVEGIVVEPDERRTGVGSALYEAAAEAACAQNRRLVSDVTRSPFAEAFWRKQQARGRAVCVMPNTRSGYENVREPNVFMQPVDELEDEAVERCQRVYGTSSANAHLVAACVKRRVDEVTARLPKPNTERLPSGGDGEFWPCLRWGARKALCRGQIDLSGVQEARRRPRTGRRTSKGLSEAPDPRRVAPRRFFR